MILNLPRSNFFPPLLSHPDTLPLSLASESLSFCLETIVTVVVPSALAPWARPLFFLFCRSSPRIGSRLTLEGEREGGEHISQTPVTREEGGGAGRMTHGRRGRGRAGVLF